MDKKKQLEARNQASKIRVAFKELGLITESQSEETSCPLIKATRTLYKNARRDVLVKKQEQVCLNCPWEECIETGDKSEENIED